MRREGNEIAGNEKVCMNVLTCPSSLTSMGLLSEVSGAQHAVVSVSSSDMAAVNAYKCSLISSAFLSVAYLRTLLYPVCAN